jgi:5'-3' exonuclease
MEYGKALVDGDVFAYRAAFATRNDPQEEALDCVDTLLRLGVERVSQLPYEFSNYQVYLTCSGHQFRHDVAKTAVYKGNRKGTEKPQHLQAIRDHMVSMWDAVESVEQEADDCLAIEATQLDYNCTIVSVDKDMMQVPCWHYNPVKDTMVKVTPAEGIKFFYTQILTGDSVDNIIGLHKVGPKTADKMLDGIEEEDDLWDAVLKAYEGDRDRVVENARLLWLRRYEGELWEPPDNRQ